MGYFLTDPFTHVSMTNFMDRPSQTQQFKTEDYDGDGSITDADTNREADLAACPNPNPQGYFPQNADGTCPTNSYTMASGAPCNCLCANNYHPVVTWVAGSPHNYPVTECQENANLGCTDEFNENYDSTATEHRHSDCGECLEGYAVNPSGGFCELIEDIPIWGCMDENARDYDSTATEHQGPCGPCNPNYARRDVTAENANETIWCEPGTCTNNSGTYTSKEICESAGLCYNYRGDEMLDFSGSYQRSNCINAYGYTGTSQFTWTPEVWTFDADEGSNGGGDPLLDCFGPHDTDSCETGYYCLNKKCVERINGCMDVNSTEYDATANTDDGTCIACITGYVKNSDGLCMDCDVNYTKDAAGRCYDSSESSFSWFPVALIGIGLVVVLS